MNKLIKDFMFKKMMEKKDASISWEQIRNYCSDEYETDKNAQEIAKEFGVNITYRGARIEFGGKNG